MVTERDTGSKAGSMRLRFNSYLDEYGTTITLRRDTTTLDSNLRATAIVTTTSTIQADVQWVTKKDLLHLNVGGAEVGDGTMFVKYDADVELEDEFDLNSNRYRITAQVEGELVKGSLVYKGYLFKKNA